MRYLITLLLLVSVACAQGIYTNSFEAGDTLVSNTVDTSGACLIYNGNSGTTRPIRPTLHVDVTEIGSNTTHYWIQVDFDIIDATSTPAKTDGWKNVYTYIWRDHEGISATSQNDFVVPMPFLEQYSFRYFRVRLTCPFGTAADSTSYSLKYSADQSGNMYAPPETRTKVYTHDMLFRDAGRQLLREDNTLGSVLLDFRIESSPGIFKVPTRGYVVTATGTSTADSADDSITVYAQGVLYNTLTTNYVDTITIPLNGVGEFSFSLGSGTGFLDEVKLIYVAESDSNDTTYFYSEVHLEY